MQTQALFWTGNAKLGSQIVSCFETIPAVLPPPKHQHGERHELIKICGLFIQTGLEGERCGVPVFCVVYSFLYIQTVFTLHLQRKRFDFRLCIVAEQSRPW